MRRTGKNHRSWDKGGILAKEGNKRRNIKNHVVGIPILNDVAIQNRPNFQIVRIRNFVSCDEYRAERTKSIETLAPAPLSSAPLQLPIASADIVCTSITQHIIQRI